MHLGAGLSVFDRLQDRCAQNEPYGQARKASIKEIDDGMQALPCVSCPRPAVREMPAHDIQHSELNPVAALEKSDDLVPEVVDEAGDADQRKAACYKSHSE